MGDLLTKLVVRFLAKLMPRLLVKLSVKFMTKLIDIMNYQQISLAFWLGFLLHFLITYSVKLSSLSMKFKCLR